MVPILVLFWKNPKDQFKFSYFSKVFPSITSRVISIRLKELETFGIVDRVDLGPKFVYVLTTDGLKLFKIFKLMQNWTEDCKNLSSCDSCSICLK